jgi:hypothetical protein
MEVSGLLHDPADFPPGKEPPSTQWVQYISLNDFSLSGTVYVLQSLS